MDEDAAVLMYAAGRRLAALYDAYRATSRANVLVQGRIASRLPETDEASALRERVWRRAALSRESDLAFERRGADVRRRLAELRAEWARP